MFLFKLNLKYFLCFFVSGKPRIGLSLSIPTSLECNSVNSLNAMDNLLSWSALFFYENIIKFLSLPLNSQYLFSNYPFIHCRFSFNSVRLQTYLSSFGPLMLTYITYITSSMKLFNSRCLLLSTCLSILENQGRRLW